MNQLDDFRDPAPGRGPTPGWHRVVLRLAAIYNLSWGLFAILFPMALFRWVGMDPLPNYPELWQCIGIIVGVYGIGYWIAGNDPIRHWPIVLVGLLGKIFGPIGFLQAVWSERFPAAMGWTILTNDLIWWIPFSLILFHAWRSNPANSAVDEQFVSQDANRNASGETVRVVWSSRQSAGSHSQS